MTPPSGELTGRSHGVLVGTPSERDAAMTRSVLQGAGVQSTACSGLADVCEHLRDGADLVILSEELLLPDEGGLPGILAAQPPWSDLPIVVITEGGTQSPVAARALASLGNVVVLERPVRISTLVSTVRTALRARERQYQIRDHLVERARSEEALREQAAALARSNAVLEDFAHIAAHDLREPLRGVRLYAHFMKEDFGDLVGETGREQIRALDALAKRMYDMLEALIDYSGVGRHELRLGAADIGTIAYEAARALSDRTGDAEIIVNEGLPVLRADRQLVARILRALVLNAATFNTSPRKRVEVGSTMLPTGQLAVYVRDNGIGIDPAHHAEVFRIFKRLHGRDAFGGGIGAGLAVSRRAVERHGGRLWLESAPGHGSTFWFTLEPDPKVESGAQTRLPEPAPI